MARNRRRGLRPVNSESLEERVMLTANDTIAQILIDSGEALDNNHSDFDILWRISKKADLLGKLNGRNASFTFFAPTDRAFMNLAANINGVEPAGEGIAYHTLIDTLDGLGNTNRLLEDLVRYHLAKGEPTLAEVVKLDEIETLEGTIKVNGRKLIDAEPDLPTARIIKDRADVPAKNGVIHTINQVLVPMNLVDKPTISELLAESGGTFDTNTGDYDVLLTAVAGAGLGDPFDDTSDDLTVFAPTDRAFIRLANELGYEGESEAVAWDTIVAALRGPDGTIDEAPILEQFINYHIVDGSLSLKQVIKAKTLTTMEGSTIRANGRTLVDADPEIINPRILRNKNNIQAFNGTVHAINRVLIPMDLDTSQSVGELLESGDDFDGNTKDFDILNRLADDAGLTDDLEDRSASYTVFAPTDRAFVRLAQDLGFEGIDERGAYDTIIERLTDLGGGSPTDLLSEIALYHVTDGAQTVRELKSAGTVTMLNGETVSVRPKKLVDNDPDFRNGNISSTRFNLLAENGFVQVISRVMLPSDLGT